MPEETEENKAPSWVDFKPPVLTTPFANGQTMNVEPAASSEPAPVPDPAPPAPEPVAPAPEPVPPMPIPTPIPEPPITPAEPPPAPEPIEPPVSTPVTSPNPPPIISITPNPPPPAPIQATGGLPRFWIWFLVGLVVSGLAVTGGYFYLNSQGPSTTQSEAPVTENTTILSESEAPSTWENNYSTSLLATQRGGLEFVVTDPEEASASATGSAGVSLKSLTVKIAKVDVHLATSPVPQASASASSGRWETLRLSQNTTVDLMDLRSRGGALSSLGVTYLAAGHYTEVRIYLTSASGVLSNGQKVAITAPGNAGIVRIVKPFDISTTGTVKLIADFDAPRSVTQTGGRYELHPVIAKTIFNGQEL